jgi:hypothetical protein
MAPREAEAAKTEFLYYVPPILQTCRHHNLQTWALFVDLVEAFNTVNHELPFALLEHYGAPKTLIDAICQMYCKLMSKSRYKSEKLYA